MATLLTVSVVVNLCLVLFVIQAGRLAHTANQRVHEAERDCSTTIKSLIDRINTSQRVQVEGARELPALQEERPYISEYEYDQERWDKHVGATDEVEA